MIQSVANVVGEKRRANAVLANVRANVTAVDIVEKEYCTVEERPEVFFHKCPQEDKINGIWCLSIGR